MWSKISHALKSRQTQEDEPSSVTGDVLNSVYEQHPNLSVFHNSKEVANPTPPGSPSKHSRRGIFKLMAKSPLEGDQIPPLKLPALSKKVRPSILPSAPDSPARGSFDTGKSSAEQSLRRPSQELLRNYETMPRSSQDSSAPSMKALRRPSLDILRQGTPDPSHSNDTRETASIRETQPRTPHETKLSSLKALRRPSLDILRQQISESSKANGGSKESTSPTDSLRPPITPINEFKSGSVRSILRDPKTPGTGQNVRFFSRDAYKVISSEDSSAENEFQPIPASLIHNDVTPAEQLNQKVPELPGGSSTAALTRASSSSPPSRPSLAELFSPLDMSKDVPPLPQEATINQGEESISITNQISSPNTSNIFDMSQQLELPSIPPGLSFNLKEPFMEKPVEFDNSTADGDGQPKDGSDSAYPTQMTSTPCKPKEVRRKDVPIAEKEGVKFTMPIDETIFHAMEKAPRLPAPLHDRSQSFSFGQTVFFSMANATKDVAESPAYPSSDLKGDMDLPSRASSPFSSKNRSRAMSDTVFHSMMRSPRPPEADINDDSSPDLVVYSGTQAEPDPFSVNANTYYTPQTMIPLTPPQGAPKHTRKTSKEENIIVSLQTQLALQTELCQQYENDLRARDELVEILGKKLADAEKEEAKRKGALRSWKKKVQELEKACRYLEEEVEGSRQESMERSVMDEASGEALRMLHRQIASLEHERTEWNRKENVLRDEIEILETIVKDRSQDVMNLKETLWSRDESDRELKEGIREAKEQIEMLGNVSVGMIDIDELKKLASEREQRVEPSGTDSFRGAEIRWEQERTELVTKIESMQIVHSGLEEELEGLKQQLKHKDDEYGILKGELEAQWANTERATERFISLDKEIQELTRERNELKSQVEELEDKVAKMEESLFESDSKRQELESEVQEIWTVKESLEKERDELEDQLHQEREHADTLTQAMQEQQDKHSILEQERQFANDNVSRLQDNIKNLNNEIAEYSQRVIQRESESEELREQMSNMKREHARVIEEQSRALREAAGREDGAKLHMEELVRQNAKADLEVKTSKDRVSALKEEVERLRRQIHELQQESADKEVKLVQITKQRAQDKEDMQGLNIALDSKQQELELLKRRIGVKGTAGSTPAQTSKIAHRRDSSVFNSTPIMSRPPSRPPSIVSDSGTDGLVIIKERKVSPENSTPSITKPSALGKSSRLNSSVAGSITTPKPTSRTVEGSMGPPPARRLSTATPTPSSRASSLTRSSSTKPATPGTPMTHRRVSSAALEQSQARRALKKQSSLTSPTPSVLELDEKENIDSASTRRRSMIPTPA